MPSVTVLGQRRALSGLETTIGWSEEQPRSQSAAAAHLAAAGGDAAPVRALLRLTEDYLACLRQSRAVLVWELPNAAWPRAGRGRGPRSHPAGGGSRGPAAPSSSLSRPPWPARRRPGPPPS